MVHDVSLGFLNQPSFDVVLPELENHLLVFDFFAELLLFIAMFSIGHWFGPADVAGAGSPSPIVKRSLIEGLDKGVRGTLYEEYW